MTEHDRQRLAAILGMLGSAHAGERAAAALQAERFRKQHGLSWGELLAAQTAPVVEVSEPQAPPEPPAWAPPPQQQATPRRGPSWDDTRAGALACVAFGVPLWAGIIWLAVFWIYVLI